MFKQPNQESLKGFPVTMSEASTSICLHVSRVSGFPTRYDTNRAVQPQRLITDRSKAMVLV